MSNYETFDDFNSSENIGNESIDQKPFQFRDDPNSEEATLEWLKNNFDAKEKMAQSRIRSYIRWSYMYKGIQWRNIGRTSYRHDYGETFNNRKPKMVDNYIWEFLDHKVSQMARLGSDIACIPWNDESKDVINAKACEKLLKARYIDMDFDTLQDEADLLKFKYGTVAQFICWNKDIGPILQAYEELNRIYKGNIPKDILKRLKVKEGLKIGDVEIKNVAPWEVFPELNKTCWKKVNEVDYIPEWVNIHELKARYPKKADEIQKNERAHLNFEENILSVPEDMVQVKHFYHKKTKFLPEGAHIIYTDDCILEKKNFPYSHGELPMVIDRDIKIENELWGRPKISNIEKMQRQTNNIQSATARDLGMGSAPKWTWPKGAVTFKTANNGFTVMEYKGAKEPKLVQNNPVSQQAIQQLDRNEERMAKLMKVYDISRGKVPQGVEANAALRFLDEQEDQANELDKKARKSRVLATTRQTISLMGQYYDKSDNRTMRILGKNNDYMIENLKQADFMRVYDVQFQNTSALPDTKTGKISTIVDMNMATQKDPVFKTPQIIKMLDLAQDEAFVDRATASTNTANMLFDALEQGNPIKEPEMHDDLLIYYNVFYQRIQEFGFIRRTPPDIKQAIYMFVKTVEGLLWQKAQYNQKVMAELQQLDYFPCFFKPNIPDPSLTQPDYVGKGQEMDTGEMKNTQERIQQQRQQQSE